MWSRTLRCVTTESSKNSPAKSSRYSGEPDGMNYRNHKHYDEVHIPHACQVKQQEETCDGDIWHEKLRIPSSTAAMLDTNNCKSCYFIIAVLEAIMINHRNRQGLQVCLLQVAKTCSLICFSIKLSSPYPRRKKDSFHRNMRSPIPQKYKGSLTLLQLDPA